MSDGDEAAVSRRTHGAARVRWWQWLLPTVGVLAVVVGAGLLLWAVAHPVPFGWFAYAPLSDTPFVAPVPWTSDSGEACLVFGLIVLAFWAGLLVGRRLRR